MEKGRVGNKRKSTKKSFDEYEKDLNDVKAVVKNPYKPEKTIMCSRCKAAMKLVKTNGSQEIYKCINCRRTTERWI